jgi:hypothetical protein
MNKQSSGTLIYTYASSHRLPAAKNNSSYKKQQQQDARYRSDGNVCSTFNGLVLLIASLLLLLRANTSVLSMSDATHYPHLRFNQCHIYCF